MFIQNVLLVLLFRVIALLCSSLVSMFLWNWLVSPAIFFPTVGFMNMVGILLALRFITANKSWLDNINCGKPYDEVKQIEKSYLLGELTKGAVVLAVGLIIYLVSAMVQQ